MATVAGSGRRLGGAREGDSPVEAAAESLRCFAPETAGPGTQGARGPERGGRRTPVAPLLPSSASAPGDLGTPSRRSIPRRTPSRNRQPIRKSVQFSMPKSVQFSMPIDTMLPLSGGDMDPCSRRPAAIWTHAPDDRRRYGPMLRRPAAIWTHAPVIRRRYGPMLPSSGGDMDPCSRRPAAIWTHAPVVRRRYGPMLPPSGGDMDPCSRRPAAIWTHAPADRQGNGPLTRNF